MGIILTCKSKGEGKVIFEILMDYEETMHLQGYMDNIHIFSEDIKLKISERGINTLPKYLVIPKEVRNNIKFNNK